MAGEFICFKMANGSAPLPVKRRAVFKLLYCINFLHPPDALHFYKANEGVITKQMRG